VYDQTSAKNPSSTLADERERKLLEALVIQGGRCFVREGTVELGSALTATRPGVRSGRTGEVQGEGCCRIEMFRANIEKPKG
jgi:hypothetical protein